MKITNMKLYANVSSERASKGQGGNDYLKIEVKNERKEIILDLMIENHNGLLGLSYFIDKTKVASIGEVLKGERQKGECNLCAHGIKISEGKTTCMYCNQIQAKKDYE